MFGRVSIEPAQHPRYLGLLSGDDPSAQRFKVWVHRLRVRRQDVAHGHCTSMVGNLRKVDNPTGNIFQKKGVSIKGMTPVYS